MTDYADKTDAELDALAAERMGWEQWIGDDDYEGPFPMFRLWADCIAVYYEPGAPSRYWSPTTDANDRDEWMAWLMRTKVGDGVLYILHGQPTPGQVTAALMSDPAAPASITYGRHEDATAGRAVVIAGLRAGDR